MAAPARSAAIQIVRPPDNVKIETPEKPKKGESVVMDTTCRSTCMSFTDASDATQRLCRNVLIYGCVVMLV